MLQIASVSGAPLQTPLGSLRLSPDWPRPPSREGLLASGNHSFASSVLNPPLAPQTKIPAPLAPQTQNPRTATDSMGNGAGSGGYMRMEGGWSAPCGRSRRKLEPTQVILSSSNAKKLS